MAKWMDKINEADRKLAKEEKEIPQWIGPMLAKLTHNYFSGDDWIFERKLDGERVLAYINEKKEVKLMSRNQKNISTSYPKIQDALSAQVRAGCILDGEVVAFNKNDVSDFQKLQPRMHVSGRKESLESKVKVYYYIFDCLFIDGFDVTDCSLEGRKVLLKDVLDYDDPLRLIKHRRGDGLDFYREACKKGWEGLIAKKSGSAYISGRSKYWLKFKCSKQQEFVVGGYTDPHGSRVGFGALLLGFYRDGKLVYCGKVGTGFDNETLKSLRKKLDNIERKTSPYDRGDPEKSEVHFVTPDIVVEVAFSEWTNDQKLRHPRYKGMRRDKAPKDVHNEDESQATDLDEKD